MYDPDRHNDAWRAVEGGAPAGRSALIVHVPTSDLPRRF